MALSDTTIHICELVITCSKCHTTCHVNSETAQITWAFDDSVEDFREKKFNPITHRLLVICLFRTRSMLMRACAIKCEIYRAPVKIIVNSIAQRARTISFWRLLCAILGFFRVLCKWFPVLLFLYANSGK